MNKLCEMVQYEHQFLCFISIIIPHICNLVGIIDFPCMLNLSIEDFKPPYINDSS